ncbi:MAG: hypothetical protein LBK27_07895 [Treponema sp.]|jgi:hypothetical protein|nr:hypothetical protein [Treponema sp.]
MKREKRTAGTFGNPGWIFRASLVCALFMSALANANSQEVKFGWSLGDFGWSYNFIEKGSILDLRAVKFNVSFERINFMISPSVFASTTSYNRNRKEILYMSFLPLELAYTPFKWEYAHISLYGRAAWEIEYVKDMGDLNKMPGAFFGALGFKIGFIPIQSNSSKYTSHLVNVFSEYTMRNEFKVGISLDLLAVLVLYLLSYT